MRYDLERDQDRQQPSQAQPPLEDRQGLGGREQLASAMGNSAMQRAASSPENAPPGLMRGAPMSIARAASEHEDEEAPAHPAEAGGHEAAPAAESAPEAASGSAAAPEPAAEAPAPALEDDEAHG